MFCLELLLDVDGATLLAHQNLCTILVLGFPTRSKVCTTLATDFGVLLLRFFGQGWRFRFRIFLLRNRINNFLKTNQTHKLCAVQTGDERPFRRWGLWRRNLKKGFLKLLAQGHFCRGLFAGSRHRRTRTRSLSRNMCRKR